MQCRVLWGRGIMIRPFQPLPQKSTEQVLIQQPNGLWINVSELGIPWFHFCSCSERTIPGGLSSLVCVGSTQETFAWPSLFYGIDHCPDTINSDLPPALPPILSPQVVHPTTVVSVASLVILDVSWGANQLSVNLYRGSAHSPGGCLCSRSWMPTWWSGVHLSEIRILVPDTHSTSLGIKWNSSPTPSCRGHQICAHG